MQIDTRQMAPAQQPHACCCNNQRKCSNDRGLSARHNVLLALQLPHGKRVGGSLFEQQEQPIRAAFGRPDLDGSRTAAAAVLAMASRRDSAECFSAPLLARVARDAGLPSHAKANRQRATCIDGEFCIRGAR